ncbi:ATP-binding cassette domain-containing protein [Desulfuromonas acetoxidans]|uniref:ABC transporter related n=1 Tax=Desulfuromonas acetoxidans (strain DSM 684 / 11070) TaxID=281689 RepID=Q1JZL0_DESA6|nr:ABC transporter ATP-binding protein [Desulfuromonas acetoxidans]EAT15557.1 ABC transporter related [Desulfuromonas acetoxidans DSM 684]MBF0646072.1 ABC transporter ATP-binding protein [Desulfuromonas acetoxidans]NVD25148.1 ABC transporter ATP-binding protein [Desulfuromonas acetoxidans]NVE17230.1 ABC transporter ATP-binding protein [Desulfuromonas acetoxidans]
MSELYRLEQIRYRYANEQRCALDIASLSFATGHLYALHGANGSGKSTLLNCLALLINPQSGSLYFRQRRVQRGWFSLPRLRRQITLVHQTPYLFDGTVNDNLRVALRLGGICSNQAQQAVDDALDSVGLADFHNRSARELSGGEQKRVAIARALALRPKVLLLDEPTANMDKYSVERLEQLISTLPDQGITVIIASHDQAQAQRLGSQVIELQGGQVVTSDDMMIKEKSYA